jgi:hypothetical protein
LATCDGEPAVAIRARSGFREAWISGRPETHDRPPDRMMVTPSGGLELLRRLLIWVAAESPRLWIDPAPPFDAYRDLRPGDRRNVPVAEVLPMEADDSLAAFIVVYTPVPFEINLHLRADVVKRVERVREIGAGRDLTAEFKTRGDGTGVLSLQVPGDAGVVPLIFEMNPVS